MFPPILGQGTCRWCGCHVWWLSNCVSLALSFSTKNLNAFLGNTSHFGQRFSLFYSTYTGHMIMGRLLRRDGAPGQIDRSPVPIFRGFWNLFDGIPVRLQRSNLRLRPSPILHGRISHAFGKIKRKEKGRKRGKAKSQPCALSIRPRTSVDGRYKANRDFAEGVDHCF